MLAASAAMDSEALEKGTPARAKAIGETDSNLVATLDDYAAISSGIGRMIASAPASRPGMRRTRGLGGDVLAEFCTNIGRSGKWSVAQMSRAPPPPGPASHGGSSTAVPKQPAGSARADAQRTVFVRLSALIDLPRLDDMMLKSEAFRRRVFEQCLAEEQLHPLFFRMVRCFPPSKSLLEELLHPYPELRWTLELNELTEVFNTGQWPAALHTVKEIAIKAMERHSITGYCRLMF
eukprot:Skav231435  [mRNA]  locus=scaffold330:239963:245787:+ [translate_table: standard]